MDIGKIKKGLDNLDKGYPRRNFLLGMISKINERIEEKPEDKPELERDKKEIKKLLIKAIKEKPIATYNLAYDSMGEGIEPLYFWTLDFMRDKPPSGLGLDVTKTREGFEASAGSGFFGEMGTRASVMQDRAMKILEVVNTVLRSVINLIYDLKEFEIRVGTYDDLKSENKETREGAELALKGVWMDQVDIKRGRGSINMLSQQLDFVTLRDAFMAANTLSEVKKLDLNKRVHNILERKISEYLKWKEISEKELRKRFQIEKNYLRTQIDSLRIYVKWIKPYLKAAQKLGMKEFNTPDIVASFNNMQIQLSLFGKQKFKPENVHESYAKVDFGNDYFVGLEINFDFRTVPAIGKSGQGGSHYVQSGRTDITFNSYLLRDTELEILEDQELYEDMDLINNLTEISLDTLQEDLDHFLKEEEPKEKPKKKPKFRMELPFGDLGVGFKEMIKPMSEVGDFFKDIFKKDSATAGFKLKKVIKSAESEAKEKCYMAYDIYKKAHGMMTW